MFAPQSQWSGIEVFQHYVCAAAPWEKLGIKIVGPLSCAPNDHWYAIMLIDEFIKCPEVCLMKSDVGKYCFFFMAGVYS